MLDEEEKRRRQKAYNQKYYAANREKFLAYIRRPEVKARRKVTRTAYSQRPEVRARKRERDRQRYRRPEVREKQREYQRKAGYASTKLWRASNREKWRAYMRRYRKRKASTKRADEVAKNNLKRSEEVVRRMAEMATRHTTVETF